MASNEIWSMYLPTLIEQYHRKRRNFDFIEYARIRTSSFFRYEIERRTRSQVGEVWDMIHVGRITSSTIHEISRCNTPIGSLVKKITGQTPAYENKFTLRGKALEGPVTMRVEQILKKNIEQCGLYLVPWNPIFGATPDGIGEDFVLEIKSPSSYANMKAYINNGKVCDKWYTQMQLQMEATGMKKGYFVVADPYFEENGRVDIRRIDYNEDYIESVMSEAIEFWEDHIFDLF